MSTEWAAVELLADASAYRGRAAGLSARAGVTPMPVLDNPALREWLADRPVGAFPEPSASGLVITVRDDQLAAAGRVLAHYTGREIRQADSASDAVELARSAAQPAVIVLEPAAVRPDFLARLPATRPVSVFTARHLAAASNLVLRTVTQQRTTQLTASSLDAVSSPGASVRESRQTGSQAVITVRAHGRECGLLLRDGMLCGRARGPRNGPGEATAGGPLTACEQGQGCFRNGWHGDRIVPIAELDGKIIVVDSCRALRVADGEFRPTVSLALATLDGTALAFVSSTWLRSQELDVGELISDMLRRGEPLAVAVAAANSALSAEPEAFGPLTVLGDGEIRLAMGAAPAIAGDRAPEIAGDPAPARRQPRPARPHAPRSPLSDLAASCALFRSSSSLRAAAARLPAGGEDSGLAPARLQHQLVRELLDEIAAEVYSFQGAWPRPLALIGKQPARCRSCGSTAAVGHQFTTPVIPSRTLIMEVCPRCTEQREGLGGSRFDWRIEGPATVYRDQPFTHTLQVRNLSALPLRGSVGGTVRNAGFHEARMHRVADIAIAPGAETLVAFDGVFPADGPVSDYHYLKFPVCLNGCASILTHPVYLRSDAGLADRPKPARPAPAYGKQQETHPRGDTGPATRTR